MIDKATVRKILDTAEIVDVVGDYVHLTKRGSNYMGLCPFHNERTPSFSVSPSRNICKCFSCGKGGSPVNFIMEKEGINFHDALLRLANKYGIKVEERELTDAEREAESLRESMYVLSEWVANEMHEALLNTKEGQDIGLQYLYQRGVTDEAIKKFRLGYSPDSFSYIYDKAVKAGFDTELLIKTGICGRSQNDKVYDRFRARVMFPIMTTAGRVVAFGGRGIKGEKAKYVNSPETPIYVKSNELYGIAQARNAMSRVDKCYLVEGYLDVIGMWQSGLENTVASSGTSLTDGQIALIHRFTKNVTLIYDGDAAGIKASLRGIDLLLRHNLNIKIVLLPDGEDPDSFSHQLPPEEFRKYIADHETDFIRFKTRILLEDAADDPTRRSEAVQSVVNSIAAIPDMVKRSVYVQECSRLLRIQESVLQSEVAKIRRGEESNLRKRIEHQQIDKTDRQQQTEQPQPDKQQPNKEAAKKTNIFAPFELETLRYCVRYGMHNFCEMVDAEGNVSWMSVLEYISDELAADNVSFQTPLYDNIFNLILDMRQEFAADYEAYYNQVLSEAELIRTEKMATLTEKAAGTLEQMEKAEKTVNEEVEQIINNKLIDYACRYVADKLINDENDNVRNLCTDLVVEKYHLSKYHQKCGTVETEFDRLPELLPRAITEWKAAILANQYQQLQTKLSNGKELSEEEINSILEQMQQISELRSNVAKQTGERIITP